MSSELQKRNQEILSLLKVLDLHSPGERAHGERVAVYSVATGERLGMSDEDLLVLRYAATLHDIGKVRLDRKLLGKLGKIDKEEIDALRLHALLAEEAIASVEWLRPCLPWIRHHHEWWNGCGYPDGLKGEQIPIGARIIGLAETFDVLVEGSPYRSQESEEDAVKEIVACSKTQFDPKVVDAFLEVQPLIQPVQFDF